MCVCVFDSHTAIFYSFRCRATAANCYNISKYPPSPRQSNSNINKQNRRSRIKKYIVQLFVCRKRNGAIVRFFFSSFDGILFVSQLPLVKRQCDKDTNWINFLCVLFGFYHIQLTLLNWNYFQVSFVMNYEKLFSSPQTISYAQRNENSNFSSKDFSNELLIHWIWTRNHWYRLLIEKLGKYEPT